MTNELDLIELRIAYHREKMHTLIQEKGTTTDSEVLEISQLLDELLSKYYQLKI